MKSRNKAVRPSGFCFFSFEEKLLRQIRFRQCTIRRLFGTSSVLLLQPRRPLPPPTTRFEIPSQLCRITSLPR